MMLFALTGGGYLKQLEFSVKELRAGESSAFKMLCNWKPLFDTPEESVEI